MKKLLLIFVALIFTLTGCNTTTSEPEVADATPTVVPVEETITEPIELSVMVPFGSTALSMSGLLINEDIQLGNYSLGRDVTYKTEIVNGADPLVAAFTSQSHDIIIAPTNLGAKFYNMGIPYKYAGAIVYGNLYLASNDTLDTVKDLEGKEIVAFSQNSTPDVVLQTVINSSDLDDVTIRYVGSVSEAQGELLAGTAQVALLAEPILSVTRTKAEINVLDLQDEWSTITGAQSYPQAAVYIKSELIENHPAIVEVFLELVQTSIVEANSTPADVAEQLQAIEFGLPAKIIEAAIPNSHLVFETALDSRDKLEFYYNKIMELNPALIGDKLPDDGFYH